MASNTGELYSLMTRWTVNVHKLLFCCYINTLIMFIVKQSSVTDVTVASLHNELFGRQTNNFILCYFIALQSLKENEVYETEVLREKVKSNQRHCRSLQCAKKTKRLETTMPHVPLASPNMFTHLFFKNHFYHFNSHKAQVQFSSGKFGNVKFIFKMNMNEEHQLTVFALLFSAGGKIVDLSRLLSFRCVCL